MHNGMMNHDIARIAEDIAISLVDDLSEAIDAFFDDGPLNDFMREKFITPMRLDIEDCDEDSDFSESLRNLIQGRAMQIYMQSEPIGSDTIEDIL